MAFGQDFAKGFFGNDSLKDYTHASKTFTSAGYANAPRLKFLFHVYFNINTDQLPKLQSNPLFSTSEIATMGLLVKTAELPKYSIDTEVLNQYNRKRVVQKKIRYNPVRITFHDDGSDLIRDLWYNYFSYFYKDPSQQYGGVPATNGTPGPSQTNANGFDYNVRDIYDPNRSVNDWGFVGESYGDGTTVNTSTSGKPIFFRDITIYGFNQHQFVQYTLINPIIAEWNHDTYDYSQDGGTMENTMVIDYETVKYYAGAIGGEKPSAKVPGFAGPDFYDQIQSPLARPGSTRSVAGQGGLIDAGQGIIADLSADSFNPIGAIQKAGTAITTFRGQDLRSIVKEEAIGNIKDVLRGTSANQNRSQANSKNNSAPVFNVPPRKTT
jgi:hypothetical protein